MIADHNDKNHTINVSLNLIKKEKHSQYIIMDQLPSTKINNKNAVIVNNKSEITVFYQKDSGKTGKATWNKKNKKLSIPSKKNKKKLKNEHNKLSMLFESLDESFENKKNESDYQSKLTEIINILEKSQHLHEKENKIISEFLLDKMKSNNNYIHANTIYEYKGEKIRFDFDILCRYKKIKYPENEINPNQKINPNEVVFEIIEDKSVFAKGGLGIILQSCGNINIENDGQLIFRNKPRLVKIIEDKKSSDTIKSNLSQFGIKKYVNTINDNIEKPSVVINIKPGHDLRKMSFLDSSKLDTLTESINIDKMYVTSYTQQLNIIRSIMENIKMIHDHNLVHRDIKKENIMLYYDTENNEYQTNIVDFDNMVESGSLSSECVKIKNHRNIPENAYHIKTISKSWDIYSLGKTLSEIIDKNNNLPNEIIQMIEKMSSTYPHTMTIEDCLMQIDKIIENSKESKMYLTENQLDEEAKQHQELLKINPLFLAILGNDFEYIANHYNEYDLKFRVAQGYNVLDYAARLGRYDMVEFFIMKDKSLLNEIDKDGNNAFGYAISQAVKTLNINYIKTIKIFLDFKSPLNFKYNKSYRILKMILHLPSDIMEKFIKQELSKIDPKNADEFLGFDTDFAALIFKEQFICKDYEKEEISLAQGSLLPVLLDRDNAKNFKLIKKYIYSDLLIKHSQLAKLIEKIPHKNNKVYDRKICEIYELSTNKCSVFSDLSIFIRNAIVIIKTATNQNINIRELPLYNELIMMTKNHQFLSQNYLGYLSITFNKLMDQFNRDAFSNNNEIMNDSNEIANIQNEINLILKNEMVNKKQLGKLTSLVCMLIDKISQSSINDNVKEYYNEKLTKLYENCRVYDFVSKNQDNFNLISKEIDINQKKNEVSSSHHMKKNN